MALARKTDFSSTSIERGTGSAPMRVLYIANAFIPTLQLSFVEPLKPLVKAGEMDVDLLTEQQLQEFYGQRLRDTAARDWVIQRMEQFKPTVVVFCRYSGPHVEAMVAGARGFGAATIFHIDDDLLNVPTEIGQKKYEYHNQPVRLAAVRYLLEQADLVYCSTERLQRRLESYGISNCFAAGSIYCSAEVLNVATRRQTRKIGYMGFDHAHDFEIALGALVEVMRMFPELTFDLFGPIPKPSLLNEFGSRVTVIEPVMGYAQFMKKLASLEWDIGICPLAKTNFNEVKADTKWVEYTSAGTAVIASRGTVYDVCCSENCGLLVESLDEWREALRGLIEDKNRRFELVSAAQNRLRQQYSTDRLRDQILKMFKLANFLRNATLSGGRQLFHLTK